jgi:alkylation response protein AidB-like acyl-CoA dehydrogenase
MTTDQAADTSAADASAEAGAELAALTSYALGSQPADAWAEMVKLGVVAAAVPERCGGDGVDVPGAYGVLRETGRRAASVPALATIALGVLPLARWGTEAQQDDALVPVARDGAVLSAALHEPSTPFTTAPRTTARATDGGYTLTGVKTGVPYAGRAHRVLVPATLDGAAGETTGVFVVDPAAAGVTVTAEPTAAEADGASARVALDAVAVAADALLPGGSAVLADLRRLAAAGAAATASGLLTGALDLTTSHVRDREQFGRPLATFQAVAQNVADVYVVQRVVGLAARAAVAAVAGRDAPSGDAAADPEVAAAWVVEETRTAIGTCHHLHGGLGLDRSYPLHRYSAAAADLAHAVGGGERALEVLADTLFGEVR